MARVIGDIPTDPGHAFLVLAHTDPAMFNHLTQALADSGKVYVHLDAKSDPKGWGRDPRVQFLENQIPVFWGEWSVCEATLRLMEAALRDPNIRRLTLVTGSHYPIRSSADLVRRGQQAGNVIASIVAPNREEGKGEERFRHRFVRSRNPQGILFKGKNALVRRLAPTLRYEPLVNANTGLRAGSQFWSLDRDAAEHVVARARSGDPLVRYFQKIACPDESFFATLVAEIDPEVQQHGTTYAKWASGMHPQPITLEDIQGAIESTDFWFARKFSWGSDSHLLQQLDEDLTQPN